MRRVVGSLLVGLCMVAGSAAPAGAADFVVTKTADTNDGSCAVDNCSLRDAIIAANANAGADRVVLGSGLTYTLSLGPRDPDGTIVPGSGDLDITDALTIDGNGSTIDAAGIDRVLDIQGVFLVTLNDLTIQHGSATGTLSLGGGIRILGATVVLNNCLVTLNDSTADAGSADPGGGIAAIGSYDPAGPVTALASLTLTNSRVLGNTGSNGGGIACVLCTLTATASTIATNAASATDGGGAMMVGDASSLSIARSTVTGNSSGAEGGGVSVPFGASTATIDRSRIAANTAGSGSAIFNVSSAITATNNWWGCNLGPGAGGSGCAATANGVSGGATVAPFLVLGVGAAPLTVVVGATSTATADLTVNSVSADTSAGGTLPDGTGVSFSATHGTFAAASSGTVSGKATDVFTASTAGTASLSAALDGQTVSVLLDVTAIPPSVVTGAAGAITPFAAMLNGTANPNGAATSAHFEYGLTSGYGTSTASQAVGAGNAPVAIGGGAISGLTCNTIYHFRAVAANSGGTTNGSDATITTTACPPPTLDAIADPAAILEDAGLQTINLTGITAGGAATTLVVTAASNNTALIPNPTVMYTSPNATGSLSYTPVPDANGSAIITVTVTETSGGGLSVSRTFTVNVTAVNDPPTLDAIPNPAAILEDAGLQTVNLSGITAGGGESQFLTVTATSNNTALIPNPTVTYTSPNTTGSLSYTPVANGFGSATITVAVTDSGGGTNSVSRTFTVIVTSVNDLPTISPVANLQMSSNTSTGVAFTVGDIETAAGALVVTANSSDPTVIPTSGLVVTGATGARTLTITPAPNQSGLVTVTLTVTDADGGAAATSFTVEVVPVPSLAISDASVTEGNSGTTSLTFTVTLTARSTTTRQVIVNYATRAGTATEGSDYVGASGQLTWNRDAPDAQTITVTVNGDVVPEPDETVFVDLSGAVNAIITRATGTGTIVNDDGTLTPVAWTHAVGTTPGPGTLTKTAGAGWNAGAISTQVLRSGDGLLAFVAPPLGQVLAAGLSLGDTTPDLADIDYAIQIFADGHFEVVEYGVSRAGLGALGSAAPGDQFLVVVGGGVVSYQHNGVTVYTNPLAPRYPLVVDTALFTPGATLTNVAIAGAGFGALAPHAGDIDGDTLADLTIFRPSTMTWYLRYSSPSPAEYRAIGWGAATDIPLLGDFDGDGVADPVLFRPSDRTWNILRSSSAFTTVTSRAWGLATDTLVPGDYDGDGITDLAVFRPSNATWYILKSSSNNTAAMIQPFGAIGDVPVPADYDGDGITDLAVFNPATREWSIKQSSTGTTLTATWGLATDIPVPADFDGDGKADLAMFRPSTGTWWVLESSAGFTTYASVPWGLAGDVPVAADFDGDGKADYAVFRPSTGFWWVLKSSTGNQLWMSQMWGMSGDIPALRRPY